ncbi:hypothetical protein ACS0TY_009376 [Phlomoides rotata]
MEVNGRNSRSQEKRPSGNSSPANVQKRPSENSSSTPMFVNNAATAWNESRRKWIGNVSQRLDRAPKDPIISWSTTYEDLLSTNELFPEPIPLPEMVDFLVDIWHDEGLFD